MPSDSQSGDRIVASVEIEREVDVTAVLDGWTIQEVRDYVDDQDPEGDQILVAEGKRESRRDDLTVRFKRGALEEYLDRRERGSSDGQ